MKYSDEKKLKWLKLFLLALAVLAPSVGASEQAIGAKVVVFGIELHAPIALPECPFTSYYKKSRNRFEPSKYEVTIKTACYKRMGAPADGVPMHDETIEVTWPMLQGPELAKGDVSVRMVNNLVERISFSTNGMSTQSSDLDSLMQKFGPSTESSSEKFSNRLGLAYDSIVASWDTPSGVSVRFKGISGRVDYGVVVIFTPIGEESFNRALDKVSSGRQSL